MHKAVNEAKEIEIEMQSLLMPFFCAMKKMVNEAKDLDRKWCTFLISFHLKNAIYVQKL